MSHASTTPTPVVDAAGSGDKTVNLGTEGHVQGCGEYVSPRTLRQLPPTTKWAEVPWDEVLAGTVAANHLLMRSGQCGMGS